MVYWYLTFFDYEFDFGLILIFFRFDLPKERSKPTFLYWFIVNLIQFKLKAMMVVYLFISSNKKKILLMFKFFLRGTQGNSPKMIFWLRIASCCTRRLIEGLRA